MGVLPASMPAPLAYLVSVAAKKRALDLPKLELQIVVSHYMGAGNLI